MTETQNHAIADKPETVAAIYESSSIADTYLEKRMRFSWQRLMHTKQVAALNRAIAQHRPGRVLEVAPGPARLSVELRGIQRGVMVENSEQMITIATERLKHRQLDKTWQVIGGDAFKLSSLVSRNTFEFAFTFRFLRHFRTSEREQLYESIRQCLTDSGLLMFDVVNGTVRERIEVPNAAPSKDEIPIYDVTYTPSTFETEMQRNGFDVVSLEPVLRHFTLQSGLSYRLENRSRAVSSVVVNVLEAIPSQQPLEWIALCRKKK